MAVRNAEPNATGSRRALFVAASLVVLFVVALFLRAYWNLDAAHPEEGTFLLSGGSDPYYHKHAIDAILTDTGEGKFDTLIFDPMLNYPYGSINPNPPLFQWTTAVLGSFLAPFFSAETGPAGAVLSAEEVATWWVFLWMPAIFGALTLIPIYFIGKSLFDWRVGLVAALFWAISTSSIDATGLGLSDHDAMLMFFAVLAFLFYIKTVERFRGDGNWVTNWRDGGAIGAGLGRLFAERRAGFAYALLTGVSIGAVALVWKGFPYVIGIIFAYAVLQMVLDHWRNRDSTGVFLATALALLVGTLMPYPYYAEAGLINFVTPVFFIVAALVAIGLVLIPTRDLPSILVMPAALVVGLLATVAAVFVFPNVAQKLLYATIYFKQSTLYTTIAEAHPADFATITFGIGPVPFFLALAGWFVVLVGLRQSPARAHLFAVVWGAVALYMASSAVRFLFNAIPVFAIFGAFMLVWVIDWLDFRATRKQMAGAESTSVVRGVGLALVATLVLTAAPYLPELFGANLGVYFVSLLVFGAGAGMLFLGREALRRAGLRVLQVVIVTLLVQMLIVPNAVFAADAALPRSKEVEIAQDSGEFAQEFLLKRFGAYGQNFLDPDWRQALAFLDKHDAEVTVAADRPGFLSWWDYGHWAIAEGDHPAVADNFQNAYEYAANFLLAQNESHAIQLLAARSFGLFGESSDPYARYEEIKDTIAPLIAEAAEVPLDQAEDAFAKLYGCPAGAEECPSEAISAWGYAAVLGNPSDAADFLALVEAATCGTSAGCKEIRYFATDIRMMPLDDDATPSIGTTSQSRWEEQSSIFYAPVTLAGKRADDYVKLAINVGGDNWITQEEFTERASNPIGQVAATAERLEYQQPFFNSMYYRAFVGTPVDTIPGQPVLGTQVYTSLVCALPGFGLEHFRLVYANRGVKILEYSPGAVVVGTVTEEGATAENVTVTVFDEAGDMIFPGGRPADCPGESPTGGVPHASAEVGADGQFRLRTPFALEGENLTLVATRDGVELGRTNLTGVTREAAAAGQEFTAALQLEKGAINLTVFQDGNANGVFDAANDTLVENANVTVAGVTGTTDAEGNVLLQGVPGGEHRISLESDRFEIAAGGRVQVTPAGGPTDHQLVVREKSGTLTGTLVDEAGAPVSSVFVALEPTGETGVAAQRSTDANGTFEVDLRPGQYRLNVTGYEIVDPIVDIEPGVLVEREFVARPTSG